ncbi:MAG TPA: LamG-like jellyroll fold domain-containing protein [Candidatus Acidoferrales bacterium]|nr:LamG-like jellyroll fold domain-containing protein [Candidatus Acidoferrales bacterium]
MDPVTGQFRSSQEDVEILPDGSGASATNGAHQTFFPNDIGNGVITSVGPDGTTLRSAPVGLFYDTGTNLVMVAALTNAAGEIFGSNVVVYPNAFGPVADLRYTYRRNGLEQEVILRQKLPAPESFGTDFDSAHVRLELVTEFFNAPEPAQSATVSGPLGLSDATLTFGGQLKFVRGRAFSIGNSSPTNLSAGGIDVFKSWEPTGNGTYCLVEALPYERAASDLSALPASRTAAKHRAPVKRTSLAQLMRPEPSPQRAERHRMRMAAAPLRYRNGLDLDYQEVLGSETNFVFAGDCTYLISGELDLFGTTTIEGGVCVKYPANSDNPVVFYGPVICNTSDRMPATFTASDDNSVGFEIAGSSGSPAGTYADSAIFYCNSSNSAALHDLRINYAYYALEMEAGSSNVIRDIQFINDSIPLFCYEVTNYLENALIWNATNVCIWEDYSATIAENVTADGGSGLWNAWAQPSSLAATNCLFVGLATLDGAFAGGNNATNPSASGVFRTAGGGGHYLSAGSPYRAAGTANIDPALLADLSQKTTQPPVVYDATNISSLGALGLQAQRDTNNPPDLGWHYPAADYLLGGCGLHSNLTVTAGAVVGWFYDSDEYGIVDTVTLNDGANLSFNGNATQPCFFAEGAMVQEVSSFSGYNENNASGAIMFNGSGNTNLLPRLSANFLKWTSDGNAIPLSDNWAYGAGSFKNCELYGGQVQTYGMQSLTFTNCLFFRDCLEFIDQGYALSYAFLNCTFYNGCLYSARYDYDTGISSSFWLIENTTFDGTAFGNSDNDDLGGSPSNTLFNYNAYDTNNLSWESYSMPHSTSYGTNEVVGPKDLMVGGYGWQSWFGANFYLPPVSPLIHKGNTNAGVLGLYHFTVITNQEIEGTNLVSIGYHFVATDANGNPLETLWFGIPDYLSDPNGALTAWQLKYFGYTGLDPNSDPDGNGQSLIYDYTNGLNPTDYYDGKLPSLAITRGNFQCGPPSSLLPIPLSVQVTATNGTVLTNAPLIFTVTQGELEAATNGPMTNSLAMRTDSNGMAAVYYVLPSATNSYCYVNATAWSTTNSESVTFKEHTQTAMVAGGDDFAFYLRPDGQVLAWGYELLGGVPGDEANAPVEIPGLTNITKIAAGEEQALALGADGTVWTWGYPHGGGTYQQVPIPVTNLNNVIDFGATYKGEVAVKADGTVWGWDDFYADGIIYLTPTNVPGITNACAVAAGDSHVLILLQNGKLVSWGYNLYGQLGDGDGSYEDSYSPVAVTNLQNIVQVAAGVNHSLAIDSNGLAWAWGQNIEGELGVGLTGSQLGKTNAPVEVVGLSNIVQIAGGYKSSMAVDSTGTVWQWGEFGDSDFQANLPYAVSNFDAFTARETLGNYYFSISQDGMLYSWGGPGGSDWGLGFGVTPTSNIPNSSNPYPVYFNPKEPQIEILSGNSQVELQNRYFSQALTFSVTDQNGNPLTNAPVYVQVAQGDLVLSTNATAAQFPDILLTAGTNGQVEVFAYAVDALNTNCTVNAYAAWPNGGLGIETNFHEMILSNLLPPTVSLVLTNGGTACLMTLQQPQATEISSSVSGLTYPNSISFMLPGNYADAYFADLEGAYVSESIGVNITQLPPPQISPSGGYFSTPSSIVLSLGAENLTNLVAGLYPTELGRYAEPSELQTVTAYAQGLRADGYSDEQIRTNLINGTYFRNSTEYTTKFGGPGDVYQANTNYIIEYSLDGGITWTNYVAPIQITNSVSLIAVTGKLGSSDDRTRYACLTSDTSEAQFDYLPSTWLVQYFGANYTNNPNSAPNADPDHDGLNNFQEYEYGTNPTNPDTDGDGVNDGTEVALGTDPLNFNNVPSIRLGYWRFDTTNWFGEEGQVPISFTNLICVPDWSNYGLELDTNVPANLIYHDVESNGMANILVWKGAFRFWFSPDWNSTTTNGGAGPGSLARLIELGSQGSPDGWWTLALSPGGTALDFITQTNGIALTNLTATINWTSNDWHQIVLTYSATNSLLYLDGQLASSRSGVTSYPDQQSRANGFSIGSDHQGNNQAKGEFDELETFTYPLSAAAISTNYTQVDPTGAGPIDYIGYLEGRNPLVHGASAPDTNGIVNLQIYTPLH